MPNRLTLDDLFAGLTLTSHLAQTRRQLESSGIDDVDKLRTFSIEELAGRFVGFGPKTMATYREQLRLLGYELANDKLPAQERCAAVYGDPSSIPLQMMLVHETNTRRRQLIQVLLRYAPAATLGEFNGWFEDEFMQLVDTLSEEFSLVFHPDEMERFIYGIEEWGNVSIPARQPLLAAV